MIIFSTASKNLKYAFDLSLKLGEPIIFPTDTIFGIGAAINNIQANEKIYDIKKRDKTKPFPILVGDINMARTIAEVDDISNACKNIIATGFHERTTYIFKAKKTLENLFKKDEKVAIRIPSTSYLVPLILQIGVPITATSVNKQNEKPLNNLKEIVDNFNLNLSIYINGLTSHSSSSTILDMTANKPVQIR